MKMWKIWFEDENQTVVDTAEFTNYRKARDCFDSVVLKEFSTAILMREDGTFLDLKKKTVDTDLL